MPIPLTIGDLSLLAAMLCIILLVTFEFFIFQRGKITLLVSMKRIRNSAMLLAIVFLASVLVRIISLV